ncbi:hypothetical protein V495_05773 [Pseudogymnoascus sp. VKM F-4514 (FW-929)]|nr:hypothetical protein V490_00466 [Pseudogymnoascus sp. VKM F-3557]KFY39735.1 hypothetical protein V495_05773 [Pseudogymnoascus sp. VKM F-4514 (FW-929)]KFY58059.1 hypothetical protein V497_05110 [Pseudogymnoascus sp. VKM F-4516 (FW-969)]
MIEQLAAAIAATPPMTAMLSQSALFIALWLSLRRYVSLRGPISGARTLMTINSWFYAFVSLGLLFVTLSPSHDLVARRLYHASKFYEYVDILNVVASGGEIDLHFGVHHLTTMYLTYTRVLQHSEGWRVFAALNTAHHVLMYAFFGGAVWVRPALPWTGALQLLVGIATDVWVGRGKMERGEKVWPNFVGGGILATYFVLFLRDLDLRGRKRIAKQKDT